MGNLDGHHGENQAGSVAGNWWPRMITLQKLSKSYGKTVIFDRTDYCFANHGLVCLLGPSGCGKSTLLNLLAGFDKEYQGEISIHGQSLHEFDEQQLCAYRREHIGFVFQDYHLLRGYHVLENVLLAPKDAKEDLTERTAEAKRLIKQVGLTEKQTQKIETLSGGQKQRVAIARAMMKDPTFLLADEPTGSLDRETSTELMRLLKNISKDKLVIVITHDKQIAAFADEIVTIENGKLCCQKKAESESVETTAELPLSPLANPSMKAMALKNFKVHIKRYLAVSLAISIGVFCFVESLSFQNIINRSIEEFKEKNTAYNSGYLKVKEEEADKLYKQLQEDQRITLLYRQYRLENLMLEGRDHQETMAEKYPMPKASAHMAYGVMPKSGKRQIALSPSLARKFKNQINELLGDDLILHVHGKSYTVEVSGIFNADYDDFFMSADLEQELYQQMKGPSYSITYEVERFEDIVPLHDQLQEQGIDAKSAAKEVAAFQTTFQTINRLFLTVSALLLGIGLLISSILLVKQQRSRYKELGLLSALGFDKQSIQAMILYEHLFLAVIAGILNAAWIGIAYLIQQVSALPIAVTSSQFYASICMTFVVITLISYLASRKLLRTDPAAALKK